MSSELGKSGKLGAGKSRTGSGVLYYMAVAQWQKNVHDLWLAQWWGYTHTHTVAGYIYADVWVIHK